MMSRFSFSNIIVWLRNPKWGALSFTLTVIIGLASISYLSESPARIVVVIMGLMIILAVIVVNFSLSGIGVACLQTEPISSAKAQYHQEYQVPDGYAEFDVYLSIPAWIEEFSVSINHNGPFKINTWDLPNPAIFNNGTIYCNDDMSEVPFTLRFGGDPQEIGEGSYNVHFKDEKTGRKIYSMTLNGNPQLESEIGEENMDPEIAEALESNID